MTHCAGLISRRLVDGGGLGKATGVGIGSVVWLNCCFAARSFDSLSRKCKCQDRRPHLHFNQVQCREKFGKVQFLCARAKTAAKAPVRLHFRPSTTSQTALPPSHQPVNPVDHLSSSSIVSTFVLIVNRTTRSHNQSWRRDPTPRPTRSLVDVSLPTLFAIENTSTEN